MRARGELLWGWDSLRSIYERWGLWNPETAALLGDPNPSPGGVPEQYDAWRVAVGKVPLFLERVRECYPATLALFARGALMTLGVSLLAMALAVGVGLVLAVASVRECAPDHQGTGHSLPTALASRLQRLPPGLNDGGGPRP